MYAKPKLETCSLSVEDKHGVIVQSLKGKITSCDQESSVYTNVQPSKSLEFNILATFNVNIAKPYPIYIKESSFGIVKGDVHVTVETPNSMLYY